MNDASINWGEDSSTDDGDEMLVINERSVAKQDTAAIRAARWIEDPIMPHKWWTGGPTNRKRNFQKVFYPFISTFCRNLG